MVDSPYAVLGVTEDATAVAIARRFRQLSRELHPDATGGDKAKEERLKLVTAAYEVLKRPPARRALDQRLREEREREARLREAIARVRAQAQSAPSPAPTVPDWFPRPNGPWSEVTDTIARARPASEAFGWAFAGVVADLLWAGRK